MFSFHISDKKVSNLNFAYIYIFMICFSIDLLIMFYVKELSGFRKHTLDNSETQKNLVNLF